MATQIVNQVIEDILSGIKSLDVLLGDGLKQGEIFYVWTKTSGAGLTSLLFQIAIAGLRERREVYFISTEGIRPGIFPSKPHLRSLQNVGRDTSECLHLCEFTYIDELLEGLQEARIAPGSMIIIDGLPRLAYRSSEKDQWPHPRVCIESSDLNQSEELETNLLQMLMLALGNLAVHAQTFVIISGYQLDRHIYGTFSLGTTEDRNPVVFRNSHKIVELIHSAPDDWNYSETWKVRPWKGFPMSAQSIRLHFSRTELKFS